MGTERRPGRREGVAGRARRHLLFARARTLASSEELRLFSCNDLPKERVPHWPVRKRRPFWRHSRPRAAPAPPPRRLAPPTDLLEQRRQLRITAEGPLQRVVGCSKADGRMAQARCELI